MTCPECNGMGEIVYYVETDRDENTVTVEQRRDICRTCNGSGEKPMTNADRIRSMNDEDLAKWIDWLFGRCEWCDTDKIATDDCNDVECVPCILKWLKQPFFEGE